MELPAVDEGAVTDAAEAAGAADVAEAAEAAEAAPDAETLQEASSSSAQLAVVAVKAVAAPAVSSALVVGHELSDSLGEDGRLLRMFVARSEHLKAGAREGAERNWLIRGDFYDEWLEEFARRYAPSKDTGRDLSEKQAEMAKACEGILAVPHKIDMKQEVDKLEQTVKEAEGDVYKLRDALLAAVKDLGAPRRRLGGHGSGAPMPPEAVEALKLQRQGRLREVIFGALQGIWLSGIGGEVLRVAVDQVQGMIAKFETREEDVVLARAGESWGRLKGLVSEIEGVVPGKKAGHGTKPEGKGTKALVLKALEDLGGAASTEEIFKWVEEHPEIVSDTSAKIKVNRSGRERNGRRYEVWQETLRNVLTTSFQRSAKKRGKTFIWCEKGAEMPPIEDAQPAVQALSDEGAAAAPKAKARPRKRPAPAVEGEEAAPQPKAKRKAKAKGAAAPAGSDCGPLPLPEPEASDFDAPAAAEPAAAAAAAAPASAAEVSAATPAETQGGSREDALDQAIAAAMAAM